MAQQVRMKAPAHYLRVNLEDPAEAEYWLVVLDAPRAALEAAVAAVGRDALDVRAWLERSRTSPERGIASANEGRASRDGRSAPPFEPN
jgi:hypothetical protein